VPVFNMVCIHSPVCLFKACQQDQVDAILVLLLRGADLNALGLSQSRCSDGGLSRPFP
jgi:hypothetical protein